MAISLQEFVNKTKGQRVDVPWANGQLAGQCVSLIQQYISQCLDQTMKPRGNAKDWLYTYTGEGLGSVVNEIKVGDILVWDAPYGSGYGHIAIALGDNKIYDQNNYSHDNGTAGVGSIFGVFSILRPNAQVIIDKPVAPAQPSDDKAIYYTVKNGDTLSGIAEKFNTTWQHLAQINGLSDSNLIYPNQKILINSFHHLYTIKAGDTLSEIAEKYGTTYQELAEINNISNSDLINVGQIIKLK